MPQYPGSRTRHRRVPNLEGTRDHPARARWLRPWLLFVAGLMALIAGSAVVPSAQAGAGPCRVPSTAYPTIQAAVDQLTCTTINVAAGTYFELIVIDRGITIRGAGQESTVVDGSRSGQVFTITGGTVRIESVTIQHGYNVARGGGIINKGTLAIESSTFSSNQAIDDGGGIFNSGTLAIKNSTFSDNHTGVDGSGILNEGTLTVENSLFSDNQAISDGGGIVNNGGTLTIKNSTFSANQIGGSGGGIVNNGGTLTVQNSAFSNNQAGGVGGGIYNIGTLAIENSAFSNNQADSGGGIFNGSDSTVTLGHVTFQNNTPNDCTGCVVVDYTGVPLSVTANWRGTNVNSVQSGTSVSLTNFTIVGNHPNQVVYLALVSKGETELANVRCHRGVSFGYVLAQKSNWNGDTVYIFYRGHGNLSVLPGNEPITCNWDNNATVDLGAAAFYNVDNSSAEFYSKAAPANTSSFPSIKASSTPGNLIFGWGGVGVDIPVAAANYISAYLSGGAQSVDLTTFVVGSGSNEAMFVGITSPGPLNTTVTWDGQALSLLDAYPVPNGFVDCNGNGCPTQGHLYWYFLASPHPGNRVLNVSWTNTTSHWGNPIVDIGAISFSGVNQATPFSSITHTSGLDDGVDSRVNSITIPTAPGDYTVALWGSVNMEGCKWNQTPNWPTDGHGINTMSSRAAGTSTSNTHSLIHAGSACGISVPSGGYWGMSGFNIKAQ